MKKSSLILLCTLLCRCGNLIVPDNNPPTCFEIYTHFEEDIRRNHPFLCSMEKDFDSLTMIYREMAGRITEENSLFFLMSDFLRELNDGHSFLLGWVQDTFNQDTSYMFQFVPGRDRYPDPGFEVELFSTLFLDSTYTADTPLVYGQISRQHSSYGEIGSNLGYLHVSTFNADEEIWNKTCREAFDALENCDYLFLDLRQNSGGFQSNRNTLTSYLSEESRIFAYVQYRSGPRYCEFDEPIAVYMRPGSTTYSKKYIYVGINRRSSSASQWAALALSSLPDCKLVGDTTDTNWSGGSTKHLPNGWEYGFSRHRAMSCEFENLEGTGVPPDILTKHTRIEDDSDPVLSAIIEDIRRRELGKTAETVY